MNTTGKAARIGGLGLLWVMVLFVVYGAMAELWRYANLRSLPVEVLRSSLLIDTIVVSDANAPELVYTLRLDLATTDGGNRTIHWEEDAGRAAYPEEAYDELRRWAPGTRHRVFQLRGDAQSIRLPGGSAETNSPVGLSVLAVVFVFIALVITAIAAEESVFLQRWGLRRFVGVWLIFLFVGMLGFVGLVAFNVHRLPRIFSWKPVVARVTATVDAPAEAVPPPDVQITPGARQALARVRYRVIEFPWNGTVLHAGLGGLGGVYDYGNVNCPLGADSCEIYVNPANRWDVERRPAFNKDYFVPVVLMLLCGIAFTGAGNTMRRQRR
jgi:hypothetical protein